MRAHRHHFATLCTLFFSAVLSLALPLSARAGACQCTGETSVFIERVGTQKFPINSLVKFFDPGAYIVDTQRTEKRKGDIVPQNQNDCNTFMSKDWGGVFKGTCTYVEGAGNIACMQTNSCHRTSENCTTNEDCSKFGGNIGNSQCFENYCYLDDIAFEKYQQTPSLLGIKAAIDIKAPILSIKIPTLGSFESVSGTLDSEGNISIPYLGQYMAAFYKLAVGVASIGAVIMIIIEGIKITTSFGNGEQIKHSYKHIGQAVAGLALVWGSYAFLYNINPDFVNFKVLKVKYVEREDLKVDAHTCDDPKDCPEPSSEEKKANDAAKIAKGRCTSDKVLAKKGRTAAVDNDSLFGLVDFRSYGKRSLKDIDTIVIHNGGYSAKMNSDTWQNRPAGAHYTIQRDGTIFQHAGEECVMPHAPGGNKTGIGIELNIDKANGTSCNSLRSNSSPDDVRKACSPTDAQYDSLRRLIADIVARTKATIDEKHIVGHCELGSASGHGDPRAFDWTKIGLSNDKKKTMAAGHACSWYLPF